MRWRMNSFSYPANFAPEPEGAFTVTFPDLPEAITSGDNLRDARKQAADCLGCALAGRMVDRMDVPAPSKPRRGWRMVEVPLYLAPKLALYVAMRENHMNPSQLARKLGVREPIVRNMLNPKRDTKPERIQAALEALGKCIRVAIEDAA